MQDKTIDNALLALRKAGGQQGKLAEVLLDMRGVELPVYRDVSQYRSRDTMRFILDELRSGPATVMQLAVKFERIKPERTWRARYNCVYQALLRMQERGYLVRDGKVWSVA